MRHGCCSWQNYQFSLIGLSFLATKPHQFASTHSPRIGCNVGAIYRKILIPEQLSGLQDNSLLIRLLIELCPFPGWIDYERAAARHLLKPVYAIKWL
jgi:hypothetical protein